MDKINKMVLSAIDIITYQWKYFRNYKLFFNFFLNTYPINVGHLILKERIKNYKWHKAGCLVSVSLFYITSTSIIDYIAVPIKRHR